MPGKPRTLTATAVIWLALAVPASAVDDKECDRPSNVEISACLSALLKTADADLNRVYKQAMASIDQADYMDADERENWKTSLQNAQRSWIKFKEADCSELIFYEWWGGSGAGIASLGCQIDATRLRVDDLKSRYQID